MNRELVSLCTQEACADGIVELWQQKQYWVQRDDVYPDEILVTHQELRAEIACSGSLGCKLEK